MRAVSLFSGAGGFEIGLERAGIQTVLQAENDPWCLSVLERHWPDCERVDDVRKRWTFDRPADEHGRGCSVGLSTLKARTRERARDASDIDLVYGGFPCQDLSVAGNRAGFRGERSSLWFEFHRVLSELRPQWCLIENVPGLLSSAGGRDMATVLGGLGDLGYGWAYRVLWTRAGSESPRDAVACSLSAVLETRPCRGGTGCLRKLRRASSGVRRREGRRCPSLAASVEGLASLRAV